MQTDDDQADQAAPEQPGWMGTAPGDIAMGNTPHWEQPPTSGWMGAGAGDIGVGGDDAPQWEQPPTGGWVGAGQANIGIDDGDQPGAGVGASSSHHM